jgi:prepilin peptidase CpaA
MPAVGETARWIIAILFLATLAVASISDIRDRRIPNWTVLVIAVLFVPWTFLLPGNGLLSALVAALMAFSVSLPLYFFRVIGAGDSKLLTVAALFVGMNQFPQFLVLVAFAGGVIAVVSLLTRPTRALVMLQMRGKGNFGRGIPYGVAIAIAAVYVVTWPIARDALG